MAHEITFGWNLNQTLWAAVFKNDSGTYKVNVTGSDTWEAWQDANVATYDISLTERGGGGMYTGTFPVSGTIAAGVYFIVIYQGSVAATDLPVGQGEFYWDGSAEINIRTLDTSINDDVIGADSDTLETLSDQLDALSAEDSKVLNVYGEGE